MVRRGLNTDFTDYTDFFGDVDISWSSVVRRDFEHGLHGFFLLGNAKSESLVPL